MKKAIHYIAGDVLRGSGNDTMCNQLGDINTMLTTEKMDKTTCKRCLKAMAAEPEPPSND